jgi:predicted ATPase
MIRDITIKNFKCFLDNSISFNGLTVLAGSNAVGKSTIIQALLLMRQTIDKLKMDHKPFDFDIQLNGEYLLNLGNSSQVLSSAATSEEIIFVLNDKTPNKILFKYSVSKEKPELVLKFNYSENVHRNTPLSIYNNQFHYLNAERLGPRVIQSVINQKFANTGFQGEYTGCTLANNSDYKVDKQRKFNSAKLTVPNLNKQVEYWLNYIIPGIEITTALYQEINMVGYYLRRSYSDTKPLNPNNVGFGISYVLPIIVSGLMAEKGCLLIIENPEAHLHPSGQSRIGQFLAQIASSGAQVIIETHSEHVINGIRVASLKKCIPNNLISINFFSINEKSKSPEIQHLTIDENAELSDWPYGFFDQEERDLADIFEGRR